MISNSLAVPRLYRVSRFLSILNSLKHSYKLNVTHVQCIKVGIFSYRGEASFEGEKENVIYASMTLSEFYPNVIGRSYRDDFTNILEG